MKRAPKRGQWSTRTRIWWVVVTDVTRRDHPDHRWWHRREFEIEYTDRRTHATTLKYVSGMRGLRPWLRRLRVPLRERMVLR